MIDTQQQYISDINLNIRGEISIIVVQVTSATSEAGTVYPSGVYPPF